MVLLLTLLKDIKSQSNFSHVLFGWEMTLGRDTKKLLCNIGSIATEAAAAALMGQKTETALEWLEQGRCIVWEQLLKLRTPFARLAEVNRSLAESLRKVSRKLELAAPMDTDYLSEEDPDISLETAAIEHRKLAVG
jgi:hypothetical protein